MTVGTSFDTFRKALEIDQDTVDAAKDLHERARARLAGLPGHQRSFSSRVPMAGVPVSTRSTTSTSSWS